MRFPQQVYCPAVSVARWRYDTLFPFLFIVSRDSRLVSYFGLFFFVISAWFPAG